VTAFRSPSTTKISWGPGSAVTWGPPQLLRSHGLKLEARSAESGGGASRRAYYFLAYNFYGTTPGRPPGARGLGSLNRTNPRFLRHCRDRRRVLLTTNEPCFGWKVHIGATWQIRLNDRARQRCGFVSSYFDHLIEFVL